MKKAEPLNITLPGDLPEAATRVFIQGIDREQFFGRPSLSMVIRALLEIAVAKADGYDPIAVNDYESLNDELVRMLAARRTRATSPART